MHASTLRQYCEFDVQLILQTKLLNFKLNQYICEGLGYDLRTTLKSRFFLVIAYKTTVVK